jgi:hypothetical protein
MTNLYLSSKHALGRAKKERSTISEGRLLQISAGTKRLLVALLFAVVLANNAAAQWASISYKVWPKSLWLSGCDPGGNNSDFSGTIGFQDDDGTKSCSHVVSRTQHNVTLECGYHCDELVGTCGRQGLAITTILANQSIAGN